MLEYPECDDYDCYYKGNEDRINGSDPTTFWMNHHEAYNRGSVEGELVLCDVCSAHVKETIECDLCKVRMLDRYIKFDTKHYCSRCIPRENVSKQIYYDTEEEDEDAIDEWISKAPECELKRDILECLISEAIRERDASKNDTKKRTLDIMQKNEAIIERWMPEFKDDTKENKERSLKRFKAQELPEFKSVTQFLDYLSSFSYSTT